MSGEGGGTRAELVARLREHAAGLDQIAHGVTDEGEDMRLAATLLEVTPEAPDGRAPMVRFEWDLPPVPDLGLIDARTQRRVTIVPRTLRVFPSSVGLSVYIDGPTAKANGYPGQHVRTHAFHERPWEQTQSRTLDELPEWAVPYVDYVRSTYRVAAS